MGKQVECPLCGQKLSSLFYLGQHVQKKNDDVHNGNQAQELEETIDEKTDEKPGDLTEEWKENNDSMVNEVQTPDKPADEPDYVKITELDADQFTDKEIEVLYEVYSQGYRKIEDCDKPIAKRDLK